VLYVATLPCKIQRDVFSAVCVCCMLPHYHVKFREMCLVLCVCCAALGQVMLYVDGMNGVISHNATIQWLYNLINSTVSIFVFLGPFSVSQPVN